MCVNIQCWPDEATLTRYQLHELDASKEVGLSLKVEVKHVCDVVVQHPLRKGGEVTVSVLCNSDNPMHLQMIDHEHGSYHVRT